MKPQCEERACLLRKALMGNALFSTLSGLTILFAQGWVLRILGFSDNVSLVILGVALIVFAATLVINARRQKVKTSDALDGSFDGLGMGARQLRADIRRAFQHGRKVGSRSGCRARVSVCRAAVCRYSQNTKKRAVRVVGNQKKVAPALTATDLG